jgi:hypothetical protein
MNKNKKKGGNIGEKLIASASGSLINFGGVK